MTDITPTTTAIGHLDTCGFSNAFLMHVAKYSENLFGEARIGYISFLGPTLDNLVALGELHDIIRDDENITVEPVKFLEEHIIHDAKHGHMSIGVRWANGYMDTPDVIETARKTDIIINHEALGIAMPPYSPSRLHALIPAAKAGVHQVW